MNDNPKKEKEKAGAGTWTEEELSSKSYDELTQIYQELDPADRFAFHRRWGRLMEKARLAAEDAEAEQEEEELFSAEERRSPKEKVSKKARGVLREYQEAAEVEARAEHLAEMPENPKGLPAPWILSGAWRLLNPVTQRVLPVIYAFLPMDGRIVPVPYGELQRLTGLSRRSVARALQDAKLQGWLRFEYERKKRVTIAFMQVPPPGRRRPEEGAPEIEPPTDDHDEPEDGLSFDDGYDDEPTLPGDEPSEPSPEPSEA